MPDSLHPVSSDIKRIMNQISGVFINVNIAIVILTILILLL